MPGFRAFLGATAQNGEAGVISRLGPARVHPLKCADSPWPPRADYSRANDVARGASSDSGPLTRGAHELGGGCLQASLCQGLGLAAWSPSSGRFY